MWKKLLYFIWFVSAGVSAAELECATLTTPLNGSSDSPTSTIIRWTSQAEAIGYEVSIGTSPFVNDILEQKIFTDNFTEQLDLPPNTTIYVIIIPFSNTQFTVGCEHLTFTTAPECEFFVNPISEISLCYSFNNESIIALVDFESFENFEKELIGEQRDLEITYFDSADNAIDLTHVNLIADGVTHTIHAKVKDMDNCIKETSFDLTLLKRREVEVFDNVAACDYYKLQELSHENGYYTESNGSGTQLQAGQMITNSQTIYVFDEGNICANPSSFKVSIDAGNCELQISTIDYQKFFTPNGDGINDLWQLSDPLNNSFVTPIFIYNKYGKLLYQLDSNDLGWDGNYNGTELPASDYWFMVAIGNNNHLKGHFALKR